MLRERHPVKGCVNDVSECIQLKKKEKRWNRIKWKIFRIIRKDEFEDFSLREWREGCEQVHICWCI